MTATVFAYPCVVFQLLAELLRSKNPEDLQEANRLIKNMVKEVRTHLSCVQLCMFARKNECMNEMNRL